MSPRHRRRRSFRSSPRSRLKKSSLLSQLFEDWYKVDKLYLITVLSLCVVGLLMVYNASAVSSFQQFGDKYHFLRNQTQWLIVGLGALVTAAHIPFRWWKQPARKLYLFTIGLLVLVIIPTIGTQLLGARRWISFGGFSFQPSEVAKLTLVIYLAYLLSDRQRAIKEFLTSAGLILGLVVLQPDLGTAIVLAGTALIMYWISGAPLNHFIMLAGGAIAGAIALIVSSPYRLRRLTTFLDPQNDPLGAAYHIRQILLALGSGGWWGLGLGQSRQKYSYLPEVAADSIFAVIAEELGFVGSSILILVFLFFILRGIKIASLAAEPFGKLLASGLVAWLGIQALVNLAAMVVLVPLTGIPLPFISYGGSSLVISMVSVGIILSISKSASLSKKT